MNDEQPSQHRGGQMIAFALSLYRGILAIVLGIVLIFSPNKSQALLVNLMGFFWLSSGFALIRRPNTNRVVGKRMSLIMGLVGILTGLLVVSRNITRRWVPEIAVVELLGAVILVTGVLHMLGQFRIGGVIRRRHETLNFLLGLFEFILGLMLVWSPLEYGPLTYWTATIWGLVFGGLVIGDALAQRSKKPPETETPPQQGPPEPAPKTHEG